MKNLRLQLCFLLIINTFLLSSCLKDNDADPWENNNTAMAGVMYFVNSYSDANSGLVFNLDGKVVGNPQIGETMVLKYQQFSGAQLLYPGNRRLTVSNYNENGKAIIDTALQIKVDTGYTSFIYGSKEEPKFAMTQDKVVENLKDNEAGIRFLNLAEGTGPINLIIEGQDTPLYTDRLTETGASTVQHQAFRAQTSGTYTFLVTNENGELLAKRDSRELRGSELLYGQRYYSYYTIILTGKSGDKDHPLFIGVVEHR